MKLYTVAYRRFESDSVHYVYVKANNKYGAYDKAVYEMISEMPYSAWVMGVQYKSGKFDVFNTHEGMPY